PGFDAVADWAAPFPVEIIAAILGVPEGDRQQIRHWTDDLLTRLPGDPRPPQAGMEAGLNQILYFLELIKEKRAHPGPNSGAKDMIDQLIEAEVPDDDGNLQRLSDDEIAGFSLLLASA